MVARIVALFLLASLAGCGGDAQHPDAAADGAAACVRDEDCNDGVFCTGVELCMPGAASANARGCRSGAQPCASGQTCDEAHASCVAACAGTPDADGDGARSIPCGGNDCDDHDPLRNPSQLETCDAANVDEDCNPATYGPRDLDGDGYDDARCCNGTGTTQVCGPDCDDGSASAHPALTETCNLVDDDCDGAIDEMLPAPRYYVDCDGDLFGTAVEPSITSCTPPTSAPAGCATTGARWSDTPGDCDDHDARRQRSCGACAAVDMLVVVDDSGGVRSEIGLLSREYGALADALATGDTNRDGTPDTEPVESLRVGFVTQEMALGGTVLGGTCAAPFDDAVLSTHSAGGDPSCPTTYSSRWTGFVPDDPRSDSVAFATELACRSDQGFGGCDFELPLEAALRALTPLTSALRFFTPTGTDGLGQGDGPNRGFLRPGSIVVVAFLQQEDDCTAVSPAFYSPTIPTPPLATRCGVWADQLQPTARFVDGLSALVDPHDLVMLEIVGVPPDLVATHDPAAFDYAAALADPRMASGLITCSTVDGTTALSARRMLTVAHDLEAQGARTVVGSICSTSFQSSIEALVRAITARQAERCGS